MGTLLDTLCDRSFERYCHGINSGWMPLLSEAQETQGISGSLQKDLYTYLSNVERVTSLLCNSNTGLCIFLIIGQSRKMQAGNIDVAGS